MKRIIVCGGRDYDDAARIRRVLQKVWAKHPGATLVQGGARGADRLAREWARANAVPFEEYPADWERDGVRAGFTRNKKMIELPGVIGVVAFPGGPGTAMMKTLTRARKIPLYDLDPKKEEPKK